MVVQTRSMSVDLDEGAARDLGDEFSSQPEVGITPTPKRTTRRAAQQLQTTGGLLEPIAEEGRRANRAAAANANATVNATPASTRRLTRTASKLGPTADLPEVTEQLPPTTGRRGGRKGTEKKGGANAAEEAAALPVVPEDHAAEDEGPAPRLLAFAQEDDEEEEEQVEVADRKKSGAAATTTAAAKKRAGGDRGKGGAGNEGAGAGAELDLEALADQLVSAFDGAGESESDDESDESESGGDDSGPEGEDPLVKRWVPTLAAPPKPIKLGDLTKGVVGARGKPIGLNKHAALVPRAAALKEARKSQPDTAGDKWFNLPAQQIDEQTKLDLRVLRLRGAFDPKRFYKSFDQTKFPKYFQIGTVVEGTAEYFTGRMTNAERKRTLADEILHDAEVAQYRKRKYAALQEEASKWSRKKKHKGSGERITKKPKKPLH